MLYSKQRLDAPTEKVPSLVPSRITTATLLHFDVKTNEAAAGGEARRLRIRTGRRKEMWFTQNPCPITDRDTSTGHFVGRSTQSARPEQPPAGWREILLLLANTEFFLKLRREAISALRSALDSSDRIS